MASFDRGPSARLARLFARVPDPPDEDAFWFDWGPVFYRGRLGGSARVLCVASDPGPTELIAGRNLVGNAGQRVQGFLAKLGLTRSYVCLNAWAYALHPNRARSQQHKLDEPAQMEWRNELYDVAVGADLEAVVAFGRMAQDAVALWPGLPDVKLCEVPHPSSRGAGELLDAWRSAVDELREVVTPNFDGDDDLPNYGSRFLEADYAPIPRRDLPFGVPSFLGDDSWVRAQSARPTNSVTRPKPDDGHTLIWNAPESPATE